MKLRQGFYFYVFAVLVVAAQFTHYLLASQILDVMDFGGWAFYITSCISHAACLALPGYIIYMLLCLVRLPRVAGVMQVIMAMLVSSLVHVNEQVYQLYRFHINGFVINMVTGPAAGEIFNFDMRLYAKYIALFLVITALYAAAWWFIRDGYRRVAWLRDMRRNTMAVTTALSVLIGSTLFAHLYHIYAAFYQKQSVIMSERLLPYYFPTTSYSLMTKTFGLEPVASIPADFGSGDGKMLYPLHPIQVNNQLSTVNCQLSTLNCQLSTGTRPNVLLILIDSWNPRAFTPDCMPNIYEYATRNQWFQNHVSCSNGTRSGVFGIWYAISSYYWNMAESGHVVPLVLDVARDEGYTFRNYPSASHVDPPFGRVLFAKEPNVRVETPGNSTLERDARITDDFIADISDSTRLSAPFFSFLFYDAPHSFERPEGELRFTPSWDYADYSVLHNDYDATPFWNLYRNTCVEADRNVGRVLQALEDNGLADNTLVIITGDHSQEFNENHKNYWGHNGNFSWAQIGVPLIMHTPDTADPHVYSHRTTHYDIMPTIMRTAMGVTNPEEDYSMGHQLTDTVDRTWHMVGSELNYAFIINGDTILEKSAEGGLNVYDSHMNIVTDYHFDIKQFNQATDRLNRFMK